jgi:integrase
MAKRLGLDGKLHSFRHSFISHAAQSGIPEATIREWVGHVDAGIMRQYTHIHNEASQAAMQKLAAANQQTEKGGDRDETIASDSAQS